MNIDNSYFMLSILITIIIGIVVLGLIIRWSRHQEDLNNMVFFCIKYLIESKHTQEKIDAAKALGHAKDPAALLVLIDVSNDNELQNKEVRHAAIDALYEMSSHYKKYKKLILELLKASENKEYQKIIDLIIKYFELNNEKKYVQCAYIIAREYIKLEQYEEARVWLHKAEFRNRHTIVYLDEIEKLIKFCNYQLLLKGDSLYHSQQYFEALEYYSLASRELSENEKQDYHVYLCIACVYCKLERYNDALEANMIAMQYNEGIEQEVLDLEQLLRNITKNILNKDSQSQKQIKNIEELDKLIVQIMLRLSALKQNINKSF
jgi:tetratricopeptide (TPR) repeat protein